MHILFTESPTSRVRLYPLTFTRPIADLRVGILTLSEKWSKSLAVKNFGYATEEYLSGKYQPLKSDEHTIWIIDGIVPSDELISKIKNLKPGECLSQGDRLLASKGASNPLEASLKTSEFSDHRVDTIDYTWDIFRLNGQEIRRDYQLLTKGRTSAPIQDTHTIVYGNDVFLEDGASVKAAILNAENGPIYLGKNSQVQEGAIIRGPFSMGEGSTVNIAAKVKGDTSLGPHCKIGGEVSNAVFWGYSNKGHDGFLGNAVIGEWCNLGADTNNSNLKNNYDPIRMWDYETEKFIDTGLQFCGLIMGDHSKCGINTMFNTGTIVGVSCNIYGEGFPRTIIPSFSWGGAGGFLTHHPRKALITAKTMMARRNLEPTEEDKAILNHIFENTAQYRVWEKK